MGFGGFGCLGFGGLFGVLSPTSHLQSLAYDPLGFFKSHGTSRLSVIQAAR